MVMDAGFAGNRRWCGKAGSHRRWFLLLVLALGCGVAAVRAHEYPYEPNPLGPDPVSEIRVLCHSPGSGGPASHRWLIRLEVYNRRNVSVWYLVRLRSDRPLPREVSLTFAEPALPSDFPCRIFNGSTVRGWGRLVLLEIPSDQGPFLAFRLPARGYLQMADFELLAPAPPEAFEAWEAASLSVNDLRSLEDWLPYDSLSGFRVRLPTGTPGADYASARRWKADRLVEVPEIWPARKITAEVLRRWLLPLRPPPR